MSVKDYRAVFESSLYQRDRSTRAVLLHVALQQKPDTGCYTSEGEMGAGLGISRSTVQRAVKKAKADGVLRTESFRDHLGHQITQRWVRTEVFTAHERESQASPDDARENGAKRHSYETRASNQTEPSVISSEAKRHFDQTQASPDEAGLVETRLINTLIDKSLISESLIGDADHSGNSAVEIGKISNKPSETLPAPDLLGAIATLTSYINSADQPQETSK